MTTTMKMAIGMAATAVALVVLFAPERGLLHQGPWAATGVLLLAMAGWKHAVACGWQPGASEARND